MIVFIVTVAKCNNIRYAYWKLSVGVMLTLLSLVVPKDVVMTTTSAISEDMAVIMTILRFSSLTQLAKALGLTSIRYRSHLKVSDQYWINVNPRVFVIWVAMFQSLTCKNTWIDHIIPKIKSIGHVAIILGNTDDMTRFWIIHVKTCMMFGQ